MGKDAGPQRGRKAGRKEAGVGRGIEQGVRGSEHSPAWLLWSADSVAGFANPSPPGSNPSPAPTFSHLAPRQFSELHSVSLND